MSKSISFKNRTACNTDEDQLDVILPTFVLCLRDFTLLVEVDGKEITADEYLDSALQIKPGTGPDIERFNRPRESIRRYFPKRKCFTFERPGNRKIIQHLDELPLKKLQKTFIEETQHFLDYIYQCGPKELLHSKPLTGNMFVPLVETYVSAISNGGVPNVDDAILVVANIENGRLAKVAVDEFRKNMGEIELPIFQTEEFDKIRIQLVKISLEKFRSEAVFNPEKHELKAIEEMDKLWEVHKVKNLNLVKRYCEDVLTDLYREYVGNKKTDLKYQKIGGYDEYKADIGNFKAAYRKQIKGSDECISQEVLSSFLEEEISTETQLRIADKRLSEADKKAAMDRLNEEHRNDILDREKLSEEKVRKEKEPADEHKRQMEASRKEYAKKEAEKQALFNQNMSSQREILERQITMMKEENKTIRDQHQRTINDLTISLTRKEQETRSYFERRLRDKNEEVERMESKVERMESEVDRMGSEVYRLQNRGVVARLFNWY